MPIKKVGEIFKASPLLRPRPISGAATSSLTTIAETDQPILIDDDEDIGETGISSSSAGVSQETPAPPQSKRRPMLKSNGFARIAIIDRFIASNNLGTRDTTCSTFDSELKTEANGTTSRCVTEAEATFKGTGAD